MRGQIIEIELARGDTVYLWRVGQRYYDVCTAITEFRQDGPSAHYPWFVIQYENGMTEDINSLHVLRVVRKPLDEG